MSAAEVGVFDFFHFAGCVDCLRMFKVVEVFQGEGLAVVVNLFDSQTLDLLRFMRVAGEFTITDDTSGKRKNNVKKLQEVNSLVGQKINKFYLLKFISQTLHRIKDTSPTFDVKSRFFVTLTSTP